MAGPKIRLARIKLELTSTDIVEKRILKRTESETEKSGKNLKRNKSNIL
jgi:hypothetical protein